MKSKLALLLPCLLSQSVTESAQTNAPNYDPTITVPARLRQINCDAPLTYTTNQYMIYCTIRCRDSNQLDAAYEVLRNLSKCAMTATKEPPTINVVMVLDATKFQSDQERLKVGATLDRNERQIKGKVLQSTEDGLLVAESDHVVLVTDGPKLIDDDPISVVGYYIGDYRYTTPQGLQKTVRKFTCDKTKAAEYWSSPANAKAKAETQNRTGILVP